MKYFVNVAGDTREVEIQWGEPDAKGQRAAKAASVDGVPFRGQIQASAHRILLVEETRVTEVFVGQGTAVSNGAQASLEVENERERARRQRREQAGGALGQASGDLLSPMPGRVISILVAPGDEVTAGQALAVVEAMKMENELRASADGVVKDVPVSVGDSVESNALLVSFE